MLTGGCNQRLTDDALRLLVEARRAAVAAERFASGRAPRILVSTLGPTDPVLLHRLSVILRYVSIVEAYVDALIMNLLTDHLPPPNWNKRHLAFQTLHDVQLYECSSWEEVEAAIAVRNSVAHGLGRLTASQRRNPELPSKFRLIGVSISGGQLYLSDSTLGVVFQACTDFIQDLDTKALVGT
jgi:hypothetical protein